MYQTPDPVAELVSPVVCRLERRWLAVSEPRPAGEMVAARRSGDVGVERLAVESDVQRVVCRGPADWEVRPRYSGGREWASRGVGPERVRREYRQGQNGAAGVSGKAAPESHHGNPDSGPFYPPDCR